MHLLLITDKYLDCAISIIHFYLSVPCEYNEIIQFPKLVTKISQLILIFTNFVAN